MPPSNWNTPQYFEELESALRSISLPPFEPINSYPQTIEDLLEICFNYLKSLNSHYMTIKSPLSKGTDPNHIQDKKEELNEKFIPLATQIESLFSQYLLGSVLISNYHNISNEIESKI
jgi:hypothetical protein